MIWILVAVVSGTAIAFQAGCNSVLSRGIGGPIAAALVSFCGGTVVLGTVFMSPLVARGHISLGQLPWWAWCGGILGATFVAGSAAAAPKLGAANLVAVILAAQLSAAVVMDHFALLGFQTRPLTPIRFFGLLLLFVGVIFVRRS